MSLTTCMEKKIVDHYGSEIKECVKSFSKAYVEEIAKCIATLKTETNETEILKNLTKWVIECELGDCEGFNPDIGTSEHDHDYGSQITEQKKPRILILKSLRCFKSSEKSGGTDDLYFNITVDDQKSFDIPNKPDLKRSWEIPPVNTCEFQPVKLSDGTVITSELEDRTKMSADNLIIEFNHRVVVKLMDYDASKWNDNDLLGRAEFIPSNRSGKKFLSNEKNDSCYLLEFAIENEVPLLPVDHDNTDEFLNKENKIKKQKDTKCKNRYFSKKIDDFISLIKAYKRGHYTRISNSSIRKIAGALLYLVSPVDLAPDFIPVIGWMDDVLVVILLLNAFNMELEEYREWKKDHPEY